MRRTISGVKAFVDGRFVPSDIAVEGGKVVSIAPAKAPLSHENRLYCLPGFTDVHVHLREPGFSYKETVATGTRAAARGGYAAVCAMPNLNPVPDSVENLRLQLDILRRDAAVAVYPYGAITVGEQGEKLSDMAGLAPHVCAFSDDGRGVQDAGLMREAMQAARALNKIIAAHCEVNALLRGGCIHDGAYARAHGLPGICSESEWRQIERDLALAQATGCRYHVCHISTKESVQLIRDAKQSHVDVTCETAPHYLLLDENDLRDEGRFKMNPPLRAAEDREALLQGLCDGTIDMIATDHAPHAAAEKAKGLAGSAFGIVGLETAFPLLYTYLVRRGVVTLEKLVELMAVNPTKRFDLPLGGANVWDLEREYAIDPARFASMGRATPFEGWQVRGERVETIL